MNHAPNFDPLARLYRWMELLTFGPWLSRCRTWFLPEMLDRRCALILGDGDGRFTERLLTANSAIEVDAVDSSPAMLRELLRRTGANALRIRVHAADARCWQPDRCYDLVVTHFFLDCFTSQELLSLARTASSALSPSAVWVVSEFDIPATHFGQFVAGPIVAVLYYAFGWLTGLVARSLPDYRSALLQAGFVLQARRTWLHGLLVSEMWAPASPGARDAADA